MKVVICCLNSKYIHASLAPWCLAAGVEEYCKSHIDKCVFESTINGDMEKVAEQLIACKPRLIAFSCYIWNIEKTALLSRIVKEKTGCTIVWGGPEAGYRPRDVLERYSFVDYVLSGEGEESFPLLLDAINDNGDLSSVPGLSRRVGSETEIIPEKICTGTPVRPYTDEFYQKLEGRICYIETSRGCPYRCAFCLSGVCSPLRFFDLDIIKRDIIKLSNSGTQTVKFVDRTFNADSRRANEILSFIIEHYKKDILENVCFHFEIAGDILTEETIDILSKAPYGLFQLEIGMQSFNAETLKAVNRKTNTNKLIANLKRLVALGNMHIHIDLIAGLTGEDMESFERSFDIGYSLKAQMLQMGFLKLLYGAQMREEPDKFPCEFTKEPPYEVTSTPWLSNEEIKQLKKCEDALERMYNSGRFLLTLDYLIDEVGFTPFRLFMHFGAYYDGAGKSLSEYATAIYNCFSDKCDEAQLKEVLLCDLLSSSSALQIPDFLKKSNPLHKRLKRYFSDIYKGRIRFVVLEKSDSVFLVEQEGGRDLRGRYKTTLYSLKELLPMI